MFSPISLGYLALLTHYWLLKTRCQIQSQFQVQEARNQHDDEAVKRAINEYEDALGRYIPVLMAQAKIYWDLEMYQQVC